MNRKFTAVFLGAIGASMAGYNLMTMHMARADGVTMFLGMWNPDEYPWAHPVRFYWIWLNLRLLGSPPFPGPAIASSLESAIADQIFLGFVLIAGAWLVWKPRTSYRIGFLYGVSAVLLVPRIFVWPLHRPGDSLVGVLIALVLIGSGVLILRKNHAGWLMFMLALADGIRGMRNVFTGPRAWAHYPWDFLHAMTLSVCFGFGIWYWITRRKALTWRFYGAAPDPKDGRRSEGTPS